MSWHWEIKLMSFCGLVLSNKSGSLTLIWRCSQCFIVLASIEIAVIMSHAGTYSSISPK